MIYIFSLVETAALWLPRVRFCIRDNGSYWLSLTAKGRCKHWRTVQWVADM